MSRIGRRPIAIPDKVTVDSVDRELRVKGPKGELSGRVPEAIDVEVSDGEVVFTLF
jgi:large subunit ribosomal protein L6